MRRRLPEIPDTTGEIHMVSDTDMPAFNPMLSPYYLKGLIPWEGCFPFGSTFYAEYDITCHFDTPVESLDPIRQKVTLSSGESLPYDRCLVATGARPVIPPIPGLRDSPRVYPLRTAASVKNLEKALLTARKVIVLGASLVGLKVAEVLCKREVKVILLDVVDQLLPRGAHPSSAAYLRSYFEEHGVDVRLGCTLRGMEGASEGVTCQFPDDIIEEADFVAVCTGVRPNIDFIDPGLVDMQQAVLVDERMQTNRQNLYAAGDVSQGYNLSSEKQEWLGTWGNACRQGRIAGYNMAGKEASYPGSIPQNISPFFDWTYAQLGDMQPQRDDTRYIALGRSPERRPLCARLRRGCFDWRQPDQLHSSCGKTKTNNYSANWIADLIWKNLINTSPYTGLRIYWIKNYVHSLLFSMRHHVLLIPENRFLKRDSTMVIPDVNPDKKEGVMIKSYMFQEFVDLVSSFHGYAAPGVIIGGFMVDLAYRYLPEEGLFDALCETPKCLPDAIQLLTPCTLGNGWLTVVNTGRFA